MNREATSGSSKAAREFQRLQETLTEFDGKHVDVLEEAASSVRFSDQLVERLVELSSSGESRFAIGATWLLKRLQEFGNHYSLDQTRQFLELLLEELPWEAHLHLLQLLPHLELPNRASKRWFDRVAGMTAHSNKMVRAWAYHGVAVLADRWPRYQETAQQLIGQVGEDEAASVRARLRHTAKDYPWLAE